MVEKTRDINKVITTASYYTKDFDLNFIKCVVNSLNEGRNKEENYSFSFLIDSEIEVVFENNARTKSRTTTIKNKNSRLSIIKEENKLTYERYDKKDNTLYTLTLTTNEVSKEYVIETSCVEPGVVLRKKR